MQIQSNVTRKVTDEQKKDCYVHNILSEIFTAPDPHIYSYWPLSLPPNFSFRFDPQ